jgi:16S rRNA (uracil1498-N3)-methyltransferase
VSHARFFAPAAGSPGDLVTLPADEAEHLTRVLRLGTGDAVRVFNGRGGEFESVVEAAGKRAVRVRLGRRRDAAPEPRVAVTLAQAVLKGDRMDDVVRDAVMIGVAAIQPIVTARTEVSLGTLQRGRRRERWQRVAVAAAKQCGRAVVPAILEPLVLQQGSDSLAQLGLPSPVLMLVEPRIASGTPLRELALPPSPTLSVIVGPEGGWTPDEIDAGSRHVQRMTLGARTIRADAMPLVALAAIFAKCGEF